MNTQQVAERDVVQVIHRDSSFWDCLMVVESVEPWGVRCTMTAPGRSGGVIPYRAAIGEFIVVGRLPDHQPLPGQQGRDERDPLEPPNPAPAPASAPTAGGEGTPAARWRAEGRPDPYGDAYDKERSELAGGQFTDDEVANMVAMLDSSPSNLKELGRFNMTTTVAKDRIRWLSRKLVAALALVRGGLSLRFTKYRHKKRGSVCLHLGGAILQCDSPLRDNAELEVYQEESTGQLYARRKTEFWDGRFERVE